MFETIIISDKKCKVRKRYVSIIIMGWGMSLDCPVNIIKKIIIVLVTFFFMFIFYPTLE